jgi:UDP-sugar transporter A1/2/3
VSYQLKILTTALFSVVMLGKSLNATKWTALVLLMIGVAMVQLSDSSPSSSTSKTTTTKKVDKVDADQTPWIGMVAVLTACISSGYAGVYFERVLKSSSMSLWTRNLHLATFSLFFAVLSIAPDMHLITTQGVLPSLLQSVYTV